MTSPARPDSRRELSEALDLMTRALAILDVANVPATIGAELDLAVASLSELLGRDKSLIQQLEQELLRTGHGAGHLASPWKIPEV